jgi:uncharacterized protein (DUF1501 family)
MTLHYKGTPSRRELLSLGGATGVMRLLGTPGVALAAAHESETTHKSLNSSVRLKS